MSKDIGIFFTDGCFQLLTEAGDLKSDESLETAVIISLFTDKRVSQDDLPQGHVSRRGYWGDMFPEIEGDEWGSRLWTLERSKTTLTDLTAHETEAKAALQWMIDDSVAKSVDVSASFDEFKRLILNINITKPNDEQNRFGYLWDGQEVRRRA